MILESFIRQREPLVEQRALESSYCRSLGILWQAGESSIDIVENEVRRALLASNDLAIR